MNWFSSHFNWHLQNEIVKFMVNDRNFQRTLETLCLFSYLHEWHIFWQATVVDCWTELCQKIPLIKMKIFESDSLTYKVMENCSRSWEELKRGCTLFKNARHAVPLWVITMPWKVHEPCKNIFMSTFNPWTPKLSITNFVTQGYSHTLHIYFVGVVCCSHPYMNVILS